MQSLTGMGTTGSIFLGSELLSAKGGPIKRDVSYIYEKKMRMAFKTFLAVVVININIVILVQAVLLIRFNSKAQVQAHGFIVQWV